MKGGRNLKGVELTGREEALGFKADFTWVLLHLCITLFRIHLAIFPKYMQKIVSQTFLLRPSIQNLKTLARKVAFLLLNPVFQLWRKPWRRPRERKRERENSLSVEEWIVIVWKESLSSCVENKGRRSWKFEAISKELLFLLAAWGGVSEWVCVCAMVSSHWVGGGKLVISQSPRERERTTFLIDESVNASEWLWKVSWMFLEERPSQVWSSEKRRIFHHPALLCLGSLRS